MTPTLNIVYIEDDAPSREVMALIVRNTLDHANLMCLSDNRDLLAKLRDLPHKPDLFLLDVHMAPHNGYDMIAMLRAEADYADKRIVALTASVMRDEVTRMKQSGFDGVIGKPFSIHTFPDLVVRIMQGESVWEII